MKKEIIIICVILVIIFSASFIVINYLEKTSIKLSEKINKLNENIKNIINIKIADNNEENSSENKIKKENTKDEMNNIYDEWRKNSKIWSTIVIHEELDQIEQAILRAKMEIETDELEDAVVELEQLSFLLKHVTEKEKFMLKNIF